MADDKFGVPLSEPRRLTAPAGYEAVHRAGNSWAISGAGYEDSTRLSAEWVNHQIAQWRGLSVNDTIGTILADLDPDSPFYLRDALGRMAAVTAALQMPGVFEENKQAIADLLEPLLLEAGLPTRLTDAAMLARWVQFTAAQTLSAAQKTQAQANIGRADADLAALFLLRTEQTLTALEKAQVLTNLELDARYAIVNDVAAPFPAFKQGAADVWASVGLNGRFAIFDETGIHKANFRWNRLTNRVELYHLDQIANAWSHDGVDGLFRRGSNIMHDDSNASRGAPDAVLEDQKAQGTPGGTSSTSWTARTINTKVRDPLNLFGTLGGTVLTPSVNGWIEWSAPHHATDKVKTRLFNVTSGTVVSSGVSAAAINTIGIAQGGAAVLAGQTYQIQSKSQTSRATDGFGLAFGDGVEVYTRVLFWRS